MSLSSRRLLADALRIWKTPTDACACRLCKYLHGELLRYSLYALATDLVVEDVPSLVPSPAFECAHAKVRQRTGAVEGTPSVYW